MKSLDTNNNVSPDYLRGFNDGYIIAEHTPDLAKQLSTASGASDRFIGMKHGIEQFSKEKSKSLTPDWLKDLQNDQIETDSPDKTIEKDKDGIEPEPSI